MSERPKNYNYVSDSAVIIITAKSNDEANEIFHDVVKFPEDFILELITDARTGEIIDEDQE